MADDKKITQLSQATALTPASDYIAVVKNPAGGAIEYKMTPHDFLTAALPNVYARVYNSSNISIPNSSWTSITYNSEDYDAYGFHSVVSNTSRLTVPVGYDGIYFMHFDAQFAANVTGWRWWRILLNGSTTLSMWNAYPQSAFKSPLVQPPALYELSAGDYVEGQVYQTRGVALNVLAKSNWSLYFTMHLVGRMP